MKINDAAAAVEAWAAETVEGLNATEAFDTGSIPDLPFASASIVEVTDGAESRLFPRLQRLEQERFRTLTFELLLLAVPEPAAEAATWLADAADALSTDLRGNATLGDRVYRASTVHRWSFRPPFVRIDDATEARQATMTLALAEEVA